MPLKICYFSYIGLGPTTTVTTSIPHNYVIGQLVRLLIQPTYGSYQLNEQTGYVIAIPCNPSNISNMDSKDSNPFIPNPSYGPTLPQILAIGDKNSGVISTTGRSVPINNHSRIFSKHFTTLRNLCQKKKNQK